MPNTAAILSTLPGGPVGIRPVVAADAGAMADFLAGLDANARRLRFHGGIHPQSPALLRQLTQADGSRHAAWVAVLRSDDGIERVVGEARYVRQDGGSAELAMAVATAWQGRGVADRLLATLTQHARRAGVRRLVAEVLGENRRMQAFLQRHGYAEARDADLCPDSAGPAVWQLVCTLSAPGVAAWMPATLQRLLASVGFAGLSRRPRTARV